MAEISKITLPNGVTYDIKDATARANSGGNSTNAKIDYIGDDNYVYRWNPLTSSYEKTSIYVKGDKGDQGNSGYTGAANELEVVNNLTEGGATKALSAEQGKILAEKMKTKKITYDVSANNDGATFESISALLSNDNLDTLIPLTVRYGGMSIKFIQNNYDTYAVERTEGLTTEPSGYHITDNIDPSIINGVYTAVQLSVLNTISKLPTVVNASAIYYIAITKTIFGEQITTYTKWVVTKKSDSNERYVQYRLSSPTWSTNEYDWKNDDLDIFSEQFKSVVVNWAFSKKINGDGSTINDNSSKITSAIFLKKGQIIKATFKQNIEYWKYPIIIALTDKESTNYIPVVSTCSKYNRRFIYYAQDDCYVGICSPTTDKPTIEISVLMGTTEISHYYNDLPTPLNSVLNDMSSYFKEYKEVINTWDEVKNIIYRQSQYNIVQTLRDNDLRTYYKKLDNITHITAELCGDDNNIVMLLLDKAGNYMMEYSEKHSYNFTVDMDIPEEAGTLIVEGSKYNAPIVLATYKNKLDVKSLQELNSTFINEGYSIISSKYTLGHIDVNTGKIVYGDDIGSILVSKVNNIQKIFFTFSSDARWSPLAFYDKDFNPIYIEPAHTNTVYLHKEVPTNAVYFCVCSRTKSPIQVLVKHDVNNYKTFLKTLERKNPVNVVGNPYRVIDEPKEFKPYLQDIAIPFNNTAYPIIYVDSVNGNDANTGTSSSPISSINRALELAQKRNVKILLKDGVYRIEEDININNKGYTTKFYSLTNNTVIKGSHKLLSPTDEGNGIISFAYSGGQILHEIFVNDGVRFPASAGNDVPGDLIEAKYVSYSKVNLLNGYQEFKIKFSSADDVVKLSNYVNIGYVTFYRDWRSIVGVIKSVDTTNNTISIYVAPSFKTGTVENVFGGYQKIVIKNINETLDCYSVDGISQPSLREGSFYYDIPNNKLYYKLKSNETIDDLSVEVPLPVTISINSACTFNNIKFAQFGGTLFNSLEYSGSCTDHQGGYCMDGVIKVYTSHVAFNRCEFFGFTLHCIKFYNGSSDSCVTNTYFHENGCAAVMIGERDKAAINVPKGIYIDNNVTKVNGQLLPESCAFVMTFAEDCQFNNNTISHTSYSGFNIGYVWYRNTDATGLKNCVIKGNDISKIGHPWINDLGGIYTLGDTQGIKICYNYIHDDANTRCYGIYLDEGTKNANVYKNVSLLPQHNHWVRYNRIYNNVFGGKYLTNNSSIDVIISGNIFINITGEATYFESSPLAYITTNLYWGKGCNIITPGKDSDPIIADPNFSDFDNKDFSIYDTENIDKIGFESFTLNSGAKGVGNDDMFDWFDY